MVVLLPLLLLLLLLQFAVVLLVLLMRVLSLLMHPSATFVRIILATFVRFHQGSLNGLLLMLLVLLLLLPTCLQFGL